MSLLQRRLQTVPFIIKQASPGQCSRGIFKDLL